MPPNSNVYSLVRALGGHVPIIQRRRARPPVSPTLQQPSACLMQLRLSIVVTCMPVSDLTKAILTPTLAVSAPQGAHDDDGRLSTRSQCRRISAISAESRDHEQRRAYLSPSRDALPALPAVSACRDVSSATR